MVAWQPNWNDVDFDFYGAEDGIDRARRCRRVLEDRDHVVALPLNEARREWRGTKRVAFDEEEDRLTRRTHALIDALAMAEYRVRVEIDEARGEQAQRVADRARYYEEVRAAEALARARAEEAARTAAEAAARAVPVGTTTTTTAPPVMSEVPY